MIQHIIVMVYNTRTNQSTWEKPAGWSENGKNNGGKKKYLK